MTRILRALLGYDLGVAITGTEQVGFTLILTEGFGTIPMAPKTFALLSAHAGQRRRSRGPRRSAPASSALKSSFHSGPAAATKIAQAEREGDSTR